MGVYGIAVLSFFSSGISVTFILMYGIAVSSSPAVCGVSSFWLTVVGKRRSFAVLRYCSFVPIYSRSSHVFSRRLGLISGVYMLEIKKKKTHEMDTTLSERHRS